MKVLLIEDDRTKAGQLMAALRSNEPNCVVELRLSYNSGVSAALSEKYDLVVVDMTMPVFETRGAREHPGKTLVFGGRTFLREIKRKGSSVPAIFVTQFESFGEGEGLVELPQLEADLERRFEAQFLGLVFYRPSDSGWKDDLIHYFSSLRD